MPGIYGLFHRDGRPVAADVLSAMRRPMHSGQGGALWFHGPCGLGQERPGAASTPHALGAIWDPGPQLAFVAAARLDGRDELCGALDIPGSDRGALADEELVRRAYLRWGESAPEHLLGDWSFAAWHADAQRLWVARDQQGVSTIYAFADDRHVAFASSLAALLTVSAVSRRLDELHLARVLTSWPSSRSTPYADIGRLPLSHALIATTSAVSVRRYFDVAAVSPLHFASDDDYVEAFDELFTRAVADRLRTAGPVAIALSGGLDSGAVAARAGRLRATGATPLAAIGHVPQFPAVDLGGHTADEGPYIEATARAAGIGAVTLLDSTNVTPVDGIRHAIQILGAPTHSAGHQFWMLDLLATARAMGYTTLLTGQLGNLTLSWPGLAPPSDWRTHLRCRHWRAGLLALLPETWGAYVRGWRRRWRGPEPWRAYSAIRPEFARRLHLAERMAADEHDPTFERPGQTALDIRVRMLRSSKGEFAESGAAHGVVVCDPTADLRLVTFCLSLPERQFLGPRGESRWLIRRAMRGALPPEVLENRRRGRQAADLPMRLRAAADQVEAALADCESSARAAEYLDLPHLRRTWDIVRRRADADSQRLSMAIVTRGLMVGLFLTGSAGAPD